MQTAAAPTKIVAKGRKESAAVAVAPPSKPLGTFGTLWQIVKTEGLGGLYRGVSAPLVAVAPIWAVSFWGFDRGDKMIRALCGVKPGAALTLPQLCFAGGISALPTALVMVPVRVVIGVF